MKLSLIMIVLSSSMAPAVTPPPWNPDPAFLQQARDMCAQAYDFSYSYVTIPPDEFARKFSVYRTVTEWPYWECTITLRDKKPPG